MYGLLCTDNLEVVGHSMFMNYRYALYNYFGLDSFKEVKSIEDLNYISHLFIIDEHFRFNLAIWGNEAFINRLNELKIRVIIFNSEKIYIEAFPWNVQTQEKVESIKNRHQFVCDIDEAKMLKSPVLNKFFISKSLSFLIDKVEKVNKILFVGQIDGEQYKGRKELLKKIAEIGLQVDIHNSQRKLSYKEILELYNAYKYVLCPIGTGKWFSYRHYEVTHLGSIPIQQVTEDMAEWFKELQATSIFFPKADEIVERMNSFNISGKEIMLEDYFETINLKGYL